MKDQWQKYYNLRRDAEYKKFPSKRQNKFLHNFLWLPRILKRGIQNNVSFSVLIALLLGSYLVWIHGKTRVVARRNSVVAHTVLLLLFVYPDPGYLQTFVIRDCYFLPYFLSKQSWCLTTVIFMGDAPFIEIFCGVASAGRLHIHSDTLLFLSVRSLCVNCGT